MEPIVFIPGLMSNYRLFAPQIQILSRTRSIQMATLGQAESVRDMAERVLKDAPETFALVGHSLGGNVAMEVVRRAPDRVTRLALMSTDPLHEPPNVAAERDLAMARAKAGRLSDVMRETFPESSLAPGAALTHVQNEIQEMSATLGLEAFLTQSKALQRRPDQQGTLRRISVPSLVLCGIYDRLTPPRRHELMAELIPHCGLASLDGAGHYPSLEQPQAVVSILIEWLSA